MTENENLLAAEPVELCWLLGQALRKYNRFNTADAGDVTVAISTSMAVNIFLYRVQGKLLQMCL